MHDARPLHPDPIRSRGQLELELARIAMRLRHACGQLTSGRLRDTGQEGAQALAEWFGELADELISRTEARLAVYAKERLKALAARWRIALMGASLQSRRPRASTGHHAAP
jgi:hypothetical protein